MYVVAGILSMILDVVWWVIIVQAVLSWLIAFNVINTHNEFVRQVWTSLDRMTEPMYRPIRKILPDFGGLDLSPIVILIALKALDDYLLEPMRLAPYGM